MCRSHRTVSTLDHPAVMPPEAGIVQLHSNRYRNPGQLPEGAVLVVGAGSSGAQIADELSRAGRRVYLSVSRHERPPDDIAGVTSAGGWCPGPVDATAPIRQ
jgi:cation diffusion facilitator CzcD-associated flavoprotein CzcO